jgi:hypothetical protein
MMAIVSRDACLQKYGQWQLCLAVQLIVCCSCAMLVLLLSAHSHHIALSKRHACYSGSSRMAHFRQQVQARLCGHLGIDDMFGAAGLLLLVQCGSKLLVSP